MIRNAPHPIIVNGSYLDEAARALAPLALSIGGIIGIDLKAALLGNANRLLVKPSVQTATGYDPFPGPRASQEKAPRLAERTAAMNTPASFAVLAFELS